MLEEPCLCYTNYTNTTCGKYYVIMIMTINKRIFVFFFIVSGALLLHATNIRNSVCIVSHEDSHLDSLYNAMGECLFNNGYMSTGRSMMSIEKYFGSGFVYRSKSGRSYVVTCQHVIGFSRYAKLKFEGDKPVEYKKCKVLTASRSLDLCLIECPSDVEQYALDAYANDVFDGMVVYSAGFPSIAGEPLWQYGIGIISNKNVNLGRWGDNDSIIMTQHTAQVDAGNSGGPLLALTQSDSIYKVIGVNERKASYRENTNYSLGCDYLDSLVNEYESGLKIGKSLINTIEGFKNSVKSGPQDMAFYISSKWVFSLDCKDITMLLKNSSQAAGSEIRNGYPIYGISCLIAESIRDNIANVNEFSVVIDEEDVDNAITSFKSDKKQWRLHWIKDLDEWKIISDECTNSKNGYSSVSTKINKKKYGIDDSNMRNMIGLSYYLPLTQTQGPTIMLKYTGTFKKYGMIDCEIGVVSYRSKLDASKCLGPYYGMGCNLSLGADVPLHLHRVALVPYALAGIAYEVWTDNNYPKELLSPFLTVKSGLKLGYEFLNGNLIFLGLEYAYKVLMTSDISHVEYGYPLNNISVMIGYAW